VVRLPNASHTGILCFSEEVIHNIYFWALLLFFFFVSSLPVRASCNYTVENGIRIMENQTCTDSITIEGAAWSNGIIRNNIFKNQNSYGMQIGDLTNLVIEDNEFFGMSNNAIKLRSTQTVGTTNVIIRNNDFHDMPASAILTGEPNVGVKILNNTFTNVGNEPDTGLNQHGIYLKGPDYLVEGNVFDGIANSNGVSVRTAGVVRGNLIKNANKRAIKYYSDSNSVGTGLLVIENNVCVSNDGGGLAIEEGAGTKITKAVLRFNTLVNNTQGVWVGPNMGGLQIEIYGNIIVESNADYYLFDSTADLNTDNITGQTDIGFENYTTGVYKLRSTSTAIQSVSGIPGIPPYDYLGNSMGQDPYDAGAFQFQANNPPPNVIADLSAGSATVNSMVLTWTAPGDDGNIGTAFAYDIRYSQSTITEANFNNATAVIGVPDPQVAGTAEHFTVYPLNASKLYYFAIKTIDHQGNISIISNIASSQTLDPPLDTDLDGLSDSEESGYGTNPNDADTDDDALNDFAEVSTHHTNPTDSDSDNDGMSDGDEIEMGTNPNQDNNISDTDLDGLSDAQEIQLGTDINDSDTDNDGFSDSKEVSLGLNPLDSESLPATIKITADNKYTLYINGQLIGTDSNWATTESYVVNIQQGDSITVKAEDQGGIAAFVCNIVHGTETQVSDFTWHAFSSTSDPSGWTDPNFDDSSWPSAKEHYSMGQGPWGNLTAFSSRTKWIWSSDANNHNKVFFRTKYDPSQNAMIKATGDNEIEIYKNGEFLSSGVNWSSIKFIPAHIESGDLIGFNGVDHGGIGAVIGEITWRDAQGNLSSLVTDASWKVSTTEVSGWEFQDFDDSEWLGATAVAAFGKAPWGTPTLLSYISSKAQWIWSSDAYGNDDVWLRKIIPNATLNMTCDNAFEVYQNGKMVGKGSNWAQTQTMGLILSPGDIIAVKAMDAGGIAALMASISHEGGTKTLTNSTWLFSTVEENGWNTQDFDDSAWQESVMLGPNGMSPWGTVSAIDSGAQWIWSGDNLNDNTVYFRFRIGDNNTPVGLTQIKVAADNSYKFYKNGNLVISGNNWTVPQNFSITLKPGDVLAVEASDLGYKAGLLLSTSGSYSVASDSTWKISTSAEEGWNTQDFDDSAWGFATSYGGYGVSPWGFNLPLFSGTSAQWIWSDRNQTGTTNIDSKIYLRKVIS
jgi:hypothetical protein